MPSKNIYQAKQIVRKDSQGVYRTVYLRELSWVFDCPDCEYIMTALNEEGAEALQHMHMTTAASIHLESLGEVLWNESALSQADLLTEHGLSASGLIKRWNKESLEERNDRMDQEVIHGRDPDPMDHMR